MRKELLPVINNQEKTPNQLWWWLVGVSAIVGLSLAAASDSAKRGVRERAGGRCENCGEQVGSAGVVGHLDHTKILAKNGHRSNRYNTLNNLRFHCYSCEAEWHLQHIGRARDIGLSEKDNYSSSIGNLMSLYYFSAPKFWLLYEKHQVKIEALFSKLGKELPSR
ncbi:MAG: HNH endonuclease [Patescibacteria group bacterium]